MLAVGCALQRHGPAFPIRRKRPRVPVGGCRQTHPAVATEPAEPEAKLIVTPENMLVGKVSTLQHRRAVCGAGFSRRPIADADQKMFVYRQGLKVGEVKVVGPERDHMTDRRPDRR
jgi:hypothetical protein